MAIHIVTKEFNPHSYFTHLLGDFNLIVGDNNTGKTQFLERIFKGNENTTIFSCSFSMNYSSGRTTGSRCNDDHYLKSIDAEDYMNIIKLIEPDLTDYTWKDGDYGISYFYYPEKRYINIDVVSKSNAIKYINNFLFLLFKSRNGILCLDYFNPPLSDNVALPFLELVFKLVKAWNIQLFAVTHGIGVLWLLPKIKVYNNRRIKVINFYIDEEKEYCGKILTIEESIKLWREECQ